VPAGRRELTGAVPPATDRRHAQIARAGRRELAGRVPPGGLADVAVPAGDRKLARTVPAGRRELTGRMASGPEVAAGIVDGRAGTRTAGRPWVLRRGNTPGPAGRGPRRPGRPGGDRRRSDRRWNSGRGRRSRRQRGGVAGLGDGRRGRRGGPATTPATADQPTTVTRLGLGDLIRRAGPGAGIAARFPGRRPATGRLPRSGVLWPAHAAGKGRIGRIARIRRIAGIRATTRIARKTRTSRESGIGAETRIDRESRLRRVRRTDRTRRPAGRVPPAARTGLGIRQGLVARSRRQPARLAGLGLARGRARTDRGAIRLRRTQIVQPAGLLLRNLLGLDRLRARTPEQPPAPPGGLLVALSVVVGPFGTARSHGCWSSPAALPPRSSLELSVGGPSGDGPPPRTIRRSRGSRSATARSAPWSLGW
jgi:hypothetical protein